MIPTREPDWVGNIHHRPRGRSPVRWRVHIWEPDEAPVEPDTWASILQIWGMPGADEPHYVYGADRMQAMFLAWRQAGLLCDRVGAFTTHLGGLPGPDWPDPGDELPCFATAPLEDQPALLDRIASLLDITGADYIATETGEGLALAPKDADEPQFFSRSDALSAALARRLLD